MLIKVIKTFRNIVRGMYFKYRKITPIVLNTEETIDAIIKRRCSVTRLGDGEINLIFGSSGLKFQNKNQELSNKLRAVLQSKDDGLLVCIPYVFEESNLAMLTNEAAKFWREFMLFRRAQICDNINMDSIYGNTNFTRTYMGNINRSNEANSKYFNMVKMIWQDRDVLMVEGEFTRFGVGNDLLDNAKSVSRILAPSKNAFDKYTDIYSRILLEDKSKLILCALGPCATVLAHDLSKQGYQAIDIGHLDIEYEWFLQGADKKLAIKYKHVNEANNGFLIEENISDEKYLKQIIDKVL